MATWPTCGQRGYITPALSGVPNAQRGDKRQIWLPAPHVGNRATSPLTSCGPQRAAWGQKTEVATGHTCGQSGCITAAISGVPNTPHGHKKRNGYLVHMWAKWLHHSYHLGGPQLSAWGGKTRNGYLAHMWAKWLHHPCFVGGPKRLARGQKKQRWLPGAHVGKLAPSPLPSWVSPTLTVGTKNRNGYLAHMWAK